MRGCSDAVLRRPCVLIAGLLAVLGASAAEDDESQTVDEIVVYGTPALLGMHNKLRVAEDEFFNMFNELNTEDELDVVCRQVKKTGTRISERVCQARILDEITADYRRRVYQGLPTRAVQTQLNEARERVLRRQEALVNANPKLYEALLNYYDTKATYEAARDERCQGSSMFCDSAPDE